VLGIAMHHLAIGIAIGVAFSTSKRKDRNPDA
jgi:zinc transporter ZupT